MGSIFPASLKVGAIIDSSQASGTSPGFTAIYLAEADLCKGPLERTLK
jgi:hypothetical protein